VKVKTLPSGSSICTLTALDAVNVHSGGRARSVFTLTGALAVGTASGYVARVGPVRGAAAVSGFAIAFAFAAPAGARGTAPAQTLPATAPVTLQASSSAVASGSSVVLSGTVTEPAPTGSGGGTQTPPSVQLSASPYPFGSQDVIATTTASATGSFSFTVPLALDTRFTATVPGLASSPAVEVDALGRTISKATALSLGRARVSVQIFHPPQLQWRRARVDWWFASGRERFRSVPATLTRRLGPDVVLAQQIVTLPAGHFRWRACFSAPLDQALLNPGRPPGCTGRGYSGSGSLPAGIPGPAAIARAARYLRHRTGRTALAVIDSEGRLSGVHVHWKFVSASVVKAMLLVAYLRMLAAHGQRRVDAYSNSILYPMIDVSENTAATQCWSIVGDGRLYALARAAHMTDFSIVGIWANAQISAADQARFFFEMNSLVPPEFVGYERHLLSTIAGYESWGIPAIARPLGYQVFFKGGWRPTVLGQLVHQIARLYGHGRTFSIAAMTDGDPSMGYGIDTIQGLAAALLR
jgi:hypothetical protein